MEPKKVGRALGIGVRVAGNMVRERVERAAAAHPVPAAAAPSAHPDAAVAGNRRTVPAPGLSAKAATVKRGAKAFGQALLGPFTHAGGILWLEITGLFFALFALFFVQSVYRVLTAWRQGADHAHLLLYAVLAIAFAWFSVSSFARAYRKSKRGPRLR
jgi:Na+/H+-translocating membrane pyrophosphatase